MDDENGLELSLGLSCGGSSGKAKMRDAPSDPRVDEGSSNKNTNIPDASFKNFFQENQDQNQKQKSETAFRQQENFWMELGKVPVAGSSDDVHGNLPQFSRYQELWGSNNKTTDTEEEKSASTKRKLPYEDVNAQKKQERVVDLVDPLGKSPAGNTSVKNSRVSANTEDGSTGENEEVAESEAEGSNSWMISQREDNTKNSDTSKFTDKHVINDPNGKQPIALGNESNQELGTVAYGIPLSPLTVMTVPYPVPVKVPASASASNATVFPSPSVMQLMPVGNSERPPVQAMNTSNLPIAFGYLPMQLPTLETGSSWAFGSQPQHTASIAIRENTDGASNSEHPEKITKISNASVPALISSVSELMKGSGKHVEDSGTSSSSRVDEEGKGSTTIFGPKETASQPLIEGIPQGKSVIRPGIAPNLKFGGCGSYPDLPWVSTTGPGPNGRTISGVTYKYNKDQVKIVCACHGSHMTPEEFVQHASEDAPSQENNVVLTSFPSSKPATSAQS